jgi:hypothetical protein
MELSDVQTTERSRIKAIAIQIVKSWYKLKPDTLGKMSQDDIMKYTCDRVQKLLEKHSWSFDGETEQASYLLW